MGVCYYKRGDIIRIRHDSYVWTTQGTLWVVEEAYPVRLGDGSFSYNAVRIKHCHLTEDSYNSVGKKGFYQSNIRILTAERGLDVAASGIELCSDFTNDSYLSVLKEG